MNCSIQMSNVTFSDVNANESRIIDVEKAGAVKKIAPKKCPPPKLNASHTPVITIHAGAGAISKDDIKGKIRKTYISALEKAVIAGYDCLKNGGSAMDSIQTSVSYMEDCPLFNAGRGATVRQDGKVRLDASIMDGNTGTYGAVANLSNTKNPINGARLIAESRRGTPENGLMITGHEADKRLESMGAVQVPNDYFITPRRKEQWEKQREKENLTGKKRDNSDIEVEPAKRFGTVGAAAKDINGHLAAATSTGGRAYSYPERVGDSPVIAAGTYANSICALSGTGSGEIFIAHHAVSRVADWMEMGKLPLKQAVQKTMGELPPESGGMIGVDADGNYAWDMNTIGMFRAAVDKEGIVHIGIHEDEIVETIEEARKHISQKQ